MNPEYMVDFEKIIAAAMAEGYSEEDVAKQMTEALNKNKSKKEPELIPKEKYIQEVAARANKAVDSKEIYISDAIDILAACVFRACPDWNLTSIKLFMNELVNHVKTTVKAVSRFNELDTDNPSLKDFTDIVVDLITDALSGENECDCEDCRNKRKETAGTPSNRSDEEVLSNFFKSLGL